MNVRYFKRFRMEIDLGHAEPLPPLPEGFGWLSWHDGLLDLHADVNYACFRDEMDAIVFPSLGSRYGCRHLMREIRTRPGFVPEATWLLTCPGGTCGTVQGRRDRGGWGAIQNLGVVPEYRGRGLGTALLIRALQGFQKAGLGRVFLEVTAENEGAVRLYRRLGFRRRKTLYKAAEESLALVNV
jgi:GNAT superfamily N-acetyltransferase